MCVIISALLQVALRRRNYSTYDNCTREMKPVLKKYVNKFRRWKAAAITITSFHDKFDSNIKSNSSSWRRPHWVGRFRTAFRRKIVDESELCLSMSQFLALHGNVILVMNLNYFKGHFEFFWRIFLHKFWSKM